jgi:hypothetical protein
MAITVPEVFPKAIHLHCCQHIADNMQQRFGNKVRLLFWRAAQALIKACFKEEIAVLRKENEAAFQYLSGIPKETWSRAYQPYS